MPLIEDVLNQWESLGVFSVILPFVLIFAILYGLLTKMEFFESKAIKGLIAGSMGLIATFLGYYGDCLSAWVIATVMAVTAVLIVYILIGFMTADPKKYSWLGWIITIVVFYFGFTRFKECRIPFIEISWPWLILLALIVAPIVWMLLDKNKTKPRKDPPKSPRGPRAPPRTRRDPPRSPRRPRQPRAPRQRRPPRERPPRDNPPAGGDEPGRGQPPRDDNPGDPYGDLYGDPYGAYGNYGDVYGYYGDAYGAYGNYGDLYGYYGDPYGAYGNYGDLYGYYGSY